MSIGRLFLVFTLMTFFQQASAPPTAPPATVVPNAFRISGKVIDAITGQPLANASVSITPSNSPTNRNSPDSARFEVTDEQGMFAFGEVPAGKYVLSARHRGYIQQMYQQHEGFTTAIIVGPGLDLEDLIFGLRPGASISGIVADESGDPVRHANVMLYHQMSVGGRRRTLQTRGANTDDEGYYHFGHLNPGTYFVAVSAQPWYAQHPRTFPIPTDSADQQAVDGPSRGVRVRYFGGSFNQMVSESPESVADQNQTLDVAYPVSFYSNANDLLGATPIALHPGEMTAVDFRMHPVPAAHVLVRTPPADSNQNVNIGGVSQPMGENGTIWIPSQVYQLAPGLVEVTGVPQGRFNLVLHSQHGNTATRRSQGVQLENDGEVDLTRTTSSAVVSGVLKIEDGSPVPQPARVRLVIPATGEVFDTAVSATGEFSFKDNPVEPGTYEIIIIEPQALFIHSLSSANVKTSGRSFEITAAQDASITINASKGTGRITGVALKKDKPTSGVMIVLAPLDLKSNPALFRRDQSDSDGTFELNSVVPGRYTLMALENGWDLEWGDPVVLQKYVAGGESLQISPNQKAEISVKVQ